MEFINNEESCRYRNWDSFLSWEIIKKKFAILLLNNRSSISFAEEYKEHNLKSNVHGKPNIKLEDHVDRKALRFMGNGSAYNYVAMKEAIKDSGLKEK